MAGEYGGTMAEIDRQDLISEWLGLSQSPADGLPSWILNVMDTHWTEDLLGEPRGSYWSDPAGFTARQHQAVQTAFCDQFITQDPRMSEEGWETPQKQLVLERDGIRIDSPEAVCEHLERVAWPRLQEAIAGFDENAAVIRAQYVRGLREKQARLDPVLALPYEDLQAKPGLQYYTYGYEQYFMFYALYPEVAEQTFRLEADYAERHNALLADAVLEEGFAPFVRVDHDITDSRGTLASIESLDERWFPHFERAMRPLLRRGFRLIWHCDGNVSALIPRLLDLGFAGFQGFQYEDGMDYPAIAAMKTREGDPLLLIVGASVTTTMIFGGPDDVRREVDWLVENSGEASLALGGTSSICPGTPWENINALVESLQHYQRHGKAGLRRKVGRERPEAGGGRREVGAERGRHGSG